MGTSQTHLWIGKYWYLPISIVVATGYLIGLGLWFSLISDKIFADEPDHINLLLQVFSLGIVGASISGSVFLAKDANQKLVKGENTSELPTFLDPIGYALFILGGGATALVLYFAVKAGVAVFSEGTNTNVSTFGAWLVAITGGAGTQRVKSFLMRLAEKTTDQKRTEDAVDRYRNRQDQEQEEGR